MEFTESTAYVFGSHPETRIVIVAATESRASEIAGLPVEEISHRLILEPGRDGILLLNGDWQFNRETAAGYRD